MHRRQQEDVVETAQLLVNDFKPQELANMAWAFAAADRSDEQLCIKLLAKGVGDFSTEELEMTLWALSRGGSLAYAWNLFDKIKC